MRIGIQMDYAGDLGRAIETVVRLDAAGCDIVFVPEAYGFDAVSTLGYLAGRTRRIELASGILPIYSRTPALLAQTAAALDWLSDGRAVLGLGASGPQVVEGWHGVPYDHPVARTREVVEICRSIWRREPLVHDGLYRLPLPGGTGLGKPLKLITTPRRERVPIYLAALGERNTALAAEVAEGWLPIFFAPEHAREVWGRALEIGGAQRDPQLGPLDVVAGAPVAIGEDVAPLRERARPMLALYVGGMGAKGRNFYHRLVTAYGYGAEADRIQELYLAGHRREAEAAVPSRLLEETTLIGPASYVAERLAAYREAGVTTLALSVVEGDPVAVVEQVGAWVA